MMKRWIVPLAAASLALLVGSTAAYGDRLRAGFAFEYGTTSSAFGLVSPAFSVPYQSNTSSDGIFSGILEYVVARGRPLSVGIAFKGSFAVSGWNLGSPGVTDSLGTSYYPDDVHISADWWALGAFLTGHLRLGPFASIDGAVGYGPYGYLNVSYWDDAGVVSGPVSGGDGLFPQHAWSIDWSAGMSFGFFPFASLGFNVGMMGPDFVAGVALYFLL